MRFPMIRPTRWKWSPLIAGFVVVALHPGYASAANLTVGTNPDPATAQCCYNQIVSYFDNDELAVLSYDTGVISVPNGTFNGRASVDPFTGALRSYATASSTAMTTGLAGGAASAGFSLETRLEGPVLGGDPVDLLVMLDVTANFSTTAPAGLASTLVQSSLSVSNGVGNGCGERTYRVGFIRIRGLGTDTLVSTDISEYQDFNSGPRLPFEDGVVDVATGDGGIVGHVAVPLKVTAGSTFCLGTSILTTASVGSGGAASNSVTNDASNTAALSFLLPAGYSLVSTDVTGALVNAPGVSAVPAPPSAVLLFTSLGALWARSRRRCERRTA